MGRYISAALSRPLPGRDGEFNAWYDQHHVPEVLTVPGALAAQRFRLLGCNLYLALYWIETEDIAGYIAEVSSRNGTPRMPRTDALDRAALEIIIGEEQERISRRVTSPPRFVQFLLHGSAEADAAALATQPDCPSVTRCRVIRPTDAADRFMTVVEVASEVAPAFPAATRAFVGQALR